MNDNFVVIHGIGSEDLANGIADVLKEFKDYKVQQTPIIINAENYTVVQIKKNLEDYLSGNIPKNPAPPNWDGTVEHAPVPKPVPPPQPVNNNPQEQGNPKDLKNPKSTDAKGANPQSPDPQFGPPPSPGGDPNKKG